VIHVTCYKLKFTGTICNQLIYFVTVEKREAITIRNIYLTPNVLVEKFAVSQIYSKFHQVFQFSKELKILSYKLVEFQ